MDIKGHKPLSNGLAFMLRERTTGKDQERIAKKWGVHFNTLYNRIQEDNRVIVMKKYVKMIEDLSEIAFQNNENYIEISKNYQKEFKRLLQKK